MIDFSINEHADGMFSFSIKQDGRYIPQNGERVEWFTNRSACEAAAKRKVESMVGFAPGQCSGYTNACEQDEGA
jgi:hypothetical protein